MVASKKQHEDPFTQTKITKAVAAGLIDAGKAAELINQPTYEVNAFLNPMLTALYETEGKDVTMADISEAAAPKTAKPRKKQAKNPKKEMKVKAKTQPKAKVAAKALEAPKRGRGRPKGSKSKPKPEIVQQAAKRGPGRPKKTKLPAKPMNGIMSQIEAAAAVLKESSEPMTLRQIHDAMIAKKLWSSPAGKTPIQSLSCSVQREIAKKGSKSRFKRGKQRGTFLPTKHA